MNMNTSMQPSTDRLESLFTGAQSARYFTVEKSTASAVSFAMEQPKMIAPLFQTLGIGQNVDVSA